jgi:hypothetical protein
MLATSWRRVFTSGSLLCCVAPYVGLPRKMPVYSTTASQGPTNTQSDRWSSGQALKHPGSNLALPSPNVIAQTWCELFGTLFEYRHVQYSHHMNKLASVADLLERECGPTIKEWLRRVNLVTDLTDVPLSDADRTGHLPKLFHDLIYRLRLVNDANPHASESATAHGKIRYVQG